MKRTLKQLAAGAVTALGLTLATVPAQAADTIRIGSFLSVTGPASFLGDPELKTLELYIDKIKTPCEQVHYSFRSYYDAGRDLANLGAAPCACQKTRCQHNRGKYQNR